MPVLFIFMQHSGPKHTSKLAKEWFCNEHITVLDRRAQSSDLNWIENFWNNVICTIARQHYKNLDNLWALGTRFPKTFSKELCQAVLENRGYSTKYCSNELKIIKFLLFFEIYYFYSKHFYLYYFTIQLKSSIWYAVGLNEQKIDNFVKKFAFFKKRICIWSFYVKIF